MAMPDPQMQRHFSMNYYRGPAQETFYSTNADYSPSYDDVRHMVEAGKLIEIFYDFEASDKLAGSAVPKEYAALAFDLRGRLLAHLRIPIAIPEHQAYAIGAALVGRIGVRDMAQGWPGHMAATMVQNFLKESTQLNGNVLGLEEVTFADGKKGFRYDLPSDGKAPIELEIHQSGKKFRFAGEEDWQKIYGVSQPFNGENYDDPMASHWYARMGMASLFPGNQKRHDTFREDVRAKAIWEWAFGKQGKDGLVLPDRWHKKTKRMVRSTRLGDILLANSRTANRARGVEGGAVFYDGRDPDPEIMHASDEDAAGTAALSFYLRRLDPEGMRFVSSLAERNSYKDFLQGTDDFTDRPALGFVHYDEGMLTRGIGTLLATDDEYDGFGDRKRALLFNLCHNPDDLLHLNHEQLRPLLVQRHNPIFVPLVLNRTPQVCEFDRAYKAGAGGQHSPEEYHRRRHVILSHRAFIQRVMETQLDLVSVTRPPNIVTTRSLEDDSYSRYGDLKYFAYKDAATGQVIPIRKTEYPDVYARATNKWNYVRQFDYLLRRATEGHAIEYSDDDTALLDYQERLKEVERKLKAHQVGWDKPFTLPETGMALGTIEDARMHLWTLRHACRAALFNCVPEFWVINSRGQRLPWEKVIAMESGTRKGQWPLREDRETGDHLRITFERNDKLHAIITALRVLDADAFLAKQGSRRWQEWWRNYVDTNYAEWKPFYEAFITLGVQGPPNLEASEQRRMSERKALLEIDQLMNKAAETPASDYIRTVLKTPQGQKLLAEHHAHKKRRMKAYRWTPDKMELMGYDAQTAYPTLNTRYRIDPKKLIRLKVPDVMLDHPDWDDHWHRFHIIERPHRDVLRAIEKAGPDTVVLLEGEATGMFRLAAKAVCHRLPPQGERTQQAIARAKSSYGTVGRQLSGLADGLRLLSFEQMAPVHFERKVDECIQHVALPAQDWAGLADARAGGLPKPLKKLTGIIVRDTGQEFTQGDIRLRRMSRGEETGDEYSGRLKSAQRVSLDDICKMSDAQAQPFGKLSAADLYSQWKKLFADMRVTDPAKQKLWILKLERPVSKLTYTYFNRAQQPVAAFISTRPLRGRKPTPQQRRAAA